MKCLQRRTKYLHNKVLISDLPNRLGDDIIQACECLNSWVTQGLFLEQQSQTVD